MINPQAVLAEHHVRKVRQSQAFFKTGTKKRICFHPNLNTSCGHRAESIKKLKLQNIKLYSNRQEVFKFPELDISFSLNNIGVS